MSQGDCQWCHGIPSSGPLPCVECLARSGRRRRWTREEDFVIRDLFGVITPAGIQREIYQRTGLSRSLISISVRASRLGIDYKTNQPDYTVHEIAKVLMIGVHVLRGMIDRGLIQTHGAGKCLLISPAEFGRLSMQFPPPPARWISRREMMRRLGYGEAQSSRLLIGGAIRGVRRGGRWYVDADHVDEIAAEMRSKVETRRSWRDVPGLDATRERARQYARNRRIEKGQGVRR